MDVSMDGLRWQLLDNYNSLTQKLNRNIKKYDVFEDEITIRPESIQREMDNIREALVFLAYCFDEREGGFKILDNPHFESFNEAEEVQE